MKSRCCWLVLLGFAAIVMVVPSVGAQSVSGELARYYADKEKEITAARDVAVMAGAEVLVPEALLLADNVGFDALGKWERGDFDGAKESAENALIMYTALGDGLSAYGTREEIAGSIEVLVPEYLFQADDVGLSALGRWDARDYHGAMDTAAEALVMYTALGDGLSAYGAREEIAGTAEALVPEYLFQADDVGLNAFGKWDAEDYEGARDTAEEALALYTDLTDAYGIYMLREGIAGTAEALVPEYLFQADNVGLNALEKWEAEEYYAARDAGEEALALYTDLRDAYGVYMLREEIAETAEALVPEYLFQADDVGLDALGKWEAEEYYAARDAAEKALTMYAALRFGLNAYTVREEYAEGIAGAPSPGFLSRVDIIGLDALERWEAEDYRGAKNAAETALAMYLRAATSAERERALDFGANVAVRERFDSAEAVYSRANTEFRGQRYERAANLFDECRLVFRATAEEAREKRRIAEDVLRGTEQRLAASPPANVSASLRNNQYSTESQRLDNLARQAYAEGDYAASARYSEEAMRNALLSDDYIRREGLKITEYDNAIAAASRRLDYAYSVSGALRFPSEYSRAQAAYNEARSFRTAENWDSAIAAANRVLAILSNIDGGRELTPLPSQYTVRPWDSFGDSFWNLAGLPWVYNDPYQWRFLYEANKAKLPESDNPNLIEPGIVLDIPSIKGEIRRGMWESGRTYAPLP